MLPSIFFLGSLNGSIKKDMDVSSSLEISCRGRDRFPFAAEAMHMKVAEAPSHCDVEKITGHQAPEQPLLFKLY